MTDLDDADELQLRVRVSDIESVRDVLDQLATLDATVDPQELSVVDPTADSTVEVDVGAVTPKQLEALELACVRGYYSQPRECDLADLADELDVSTSAVSQRLRAAESRLIVSSLEAIRPWLAHTASARDRRDGRRSPDSNE